MATPSLFPRSVLLTTAALLGGQALAQDQLHTVRLGDNLYNLAQRYLEDPAQWPQLQALNAVRDPRRLVPGSQLRIPASLLRPQPAPAQVVHVSGDVRAETAGNAPRTLAAGEQVTEGAQLTVADGGFVTLRLADGSTLRLPAGSSARLSELRRAPGSGTAQSAVELQRGRIDSRVAPLTSPRSRFEVRTPLAVGGVRGTQFGVAVADNGDFVSDVREGAVQVSAASRGALLRGGQGTRVGTAPGPIEVSPLLPAPDLSGLPAVIESISFVDLPLPASVGTTRWQVRVASDPALEQVLRNAEFSTPLARFAGLPDGTYQVAVRPVDARGIPGGESQRALQVNARPEAPLLREPREGSRVHGSQLEVLCTESPDVQGYVIELARDRAFSQMLPAGPQSASCQRTIAMPPPGNYFWRVAAVAQDAAGQRDQGPFSQPVAFSVVALPPVPEPPQVQGAGGDSLSIQWAQSAGGPWRHQLQLADDARFAQPRVDTLLDAPRYQGATPPPGRYFIRVRQIDPTGLEGAWTGAQQLDVPSRIVTSDNQPVLDTTGQQIRPGQR